MGAAESFSYDDAFEDGVDIMKVGTTGASFITAEEGEKLSYNGVPASHKMAGDDLERMNRLYKSMILRVGRNMKVDPAVIAGIISRESRAGKAIERPRMGGPPGWGDWSKERQAYNGFGLMQLDVNPKGGNHTPRGAWDSEEHLEQCCTDCLIKFIKLIQKKFPKWNKEQHLSGGLSAYNMGPGKVCKNRKCPGGGWEGMDASYTGEFDSDHSWQFSDSNTTGKDYASDVVARAQFYKDHGYKLNK